MSPVRSRGDCPLGGIAVPSLSRQATKPLLDASGPALGKELPPLRRGGLPAGIPRFSRVLSAPSSHARLPERAGVHDPASCPAVDEGLAGACLHPSKAKAGDSLPYAGVSRAFTPPADGLCLTSPVYQVPNSPSRTSTPFLLPSALSCGERAFLWGDLRIFW